MNSPSFTILAQSAAIHGELKRSLIAIGIVLLILFIALVVQECRVLRSAAALGWFGLICVAFLGFCSTALIMVGLF